MRKKIKILVFLICLMSTASVLGAAAGAAAPRSGSSTWGTAPRMSLIEQNKMGLNTLLGEIDVLPFCLNNIVSEMVYSLLPSSISA
ncbi:MAG: hypothetical protein HQK53_12875, partial [Oligoflexia bacterium]|nr:hypothetical protein [Oligoflexia bacterium]